jgi:Na+(H+)/acetate symporter ActP
MSTLTGVFMGMSTAIANELYKKTFIKHFRRDLPSEVVNRNSMIIARISLIIIGALAIFFALNPPEFLTILIWSG